MTSVRKVQQMLASGLDALTSGVVEGQQAVDAENYPLASGEMIQRIHVPVTGIAGRSVVYDEIKVEWPYPVINQLANGQHESDQDQPHVATGVELLTDEHVFLDAQVRSWDQDERGFYTGATVRLTVWTPDAIKAVRYSAVIHLSFMGYAAAAEDDTETTTPQDIG